MMSQRTRQIDVPVIRRKKHIVTSTEVARRAGVSQSSVSLVVGGKSAGRVSCHTERAIWKAARELCYRPNTAARTLRSGQSRLVLLAVPDVSNPYFAAALKGAEQQARKHGYSVSLAAVQTPADWQSVILDNLSAGTVDGFLLFAMHAPTERQEAALWGKAVLVDETRKGFPSVTLDIETGMRSALAHLMELGHTKIGHLAASSELQTIRLRTDTYLDVLRRSGFEIRENYQSAAHFDIEEACAAAYRILSIRDRPTAIVCDSDVLAVGVYKAAKVLKLAIPGDVSVVGIDNSIIAQIVDPELTTVAIPAANVGSEAMWLLLQVLNQAEDLASKRVALELVIRKSTSRPMSGRGQRRRTIANG